MAKKSTFESFWARVNTGRGKTCWEWKGSVNSTGYGSLMYGGAACTAHRVAAYLSGLVPTIAAPKDRKQSGFVLHSCDNRRCCNPAHMRIGSYTENQLEAYARKRRTAFKGETHTNARLTNRQATKIRELYATGLSQDALAAKYGVAQNTISLIVRNISYV